VEAESLLKDLLSQQRQSAGEQPLAVALTLLELANVLKTESKADEAVKSFREALEIALSLRAGATNAGSINDVSWQLVAHEEPTRWDGAVAAELAQKAVAATQRKNPMLLDTWLLPVRRLANSRTRSPFSKRPSPCCKMRLRGEIMHRGWSFTNWAFPTVPAPDSRGRRECSATRGSWPKPKPSSANCWR